MPCFTNLEYDDYLRLCRDRGLIRTIEDLGAEQATRDLPVEVVAASRESRMIEAAERIIAALEDRCSGADRCSADFLEVAG